jgi:hypothetical protein
MKITNREWSVIVFWFGLISLLAAALLMGGCNATKKVLKNPVATEKVALEYIKKNPRKNDTTFLPGKIIISDTTIYDTIPLPYPVKEKYTEYRNKETLVRDTIRIVDRTFENALVKRVDALEIGLTEMKQERNTWRTEAWIWRGIFFALLAFFILKPFLKQYLKFLP